MLFLVLVLNLRFLSARCGPRALTSTNGRNMALVCQMRLFTATTEGASGDTVEKKKKSPGQRLNGEMSDSLKKSKGANVKQVLC